MNDARAAGASDFVDRLVVKTFGGADVPAARVPSAYEPVRPRIGAALAGPRIDGVDGDAAIDEGEVAMDASAEPRTSRDEQRKARARSPRAAAARARRSPATPESGHARATDVQARAAAAAGNAADARDASLDAHGAVGGDEPAGALVPRPTPHEACATDASLADLAHSDRDPSASTPRAIADAAAWHALEAEAQAIAAPVAAADGARETRPATRLRASLDSGRPAGEMDDADVDGGWLADERTDRDGVLMPVGRDLVPHASDDGASVRGGASRGFDAGSDTSQPDVTVNVTIGRVDVRAVQAPASAERPTRARTAQPIALDDYLAQRGGAR